MSHRGGIRYNRSSANYNSPQQQHYGSKQNYNNSHQGNYNNSAPVTRGRQQQQQQQQQQQPVQPAQQTPVKQQDPTPPVEQQPPFLSETPAKIDAEPTPPEKMDDQNDDSKTDAGEDGQQQDGTGMSRRNRFRFWNKRGPLGSKIPKNILRRRQNARLRNLLAPKNSMMVLYELHPELKLTISEEVNATNQMTYTVKVEIGGTTFVGQGMSKAAAKQAASENALKAVLLEKLEQNNIRLSTSTGNVSVDENKTADNSGSWVDEDVEMSQTGEDGEKKETDESGEPKRVRRPIAEDDVPWGSLASFALYKLFSDWQSQGFQLPANAGISGIFQKHAPQNQQPAVVSIKKLPPDANQKHPVQLLNQIRPGSQFAESREGVPPNLTFTFSVNIDGKTFKGTGSNKKDAKKLCAKNVLESMGVKYDQN